MQGEPVQVREEKPVSRQLTRVPSSRSEAIARARALAPAIRARSRATDEQRSVPRESIREISEAGLFCVLKPREFGGAELGLATLVEVTAEIAAACGSTGWIYGVMGGHSWLLNLFPYEAQREVYDDPDALIATVFRLASRTTRVKGGYRLEAGEGRFCSGIDHAKWLIVGSPVIGKDGEPPEQRFFLVPRSDVSDVIDDWYVAGMRGTGSKSIRIREAFIPEHRSIALSEMIRGTTPGARHHTSILCRMSFQDIAPFSIVGVPLGIARAAVTTFAEALGRRMESFTCEQVAEQSAAFARLGVAAAEVDAAYATILDNAERIDRATDPAEISPLMRARIPRDWAYAAQKARAAVTSLFEASGGTATYDSSEMQRLWRDVNSAAQHVAFTWDSAMTNFGRAVAGVAPARFGPKGR